MFSLQNNGGDESDELELVACLRNDDHGDSDELALVVCVRTVCVCLVCKMVQMCFLSRLTWLSFPGGEYEFRDHDDKGQI